MSFDDELSHQALTAANKEKEGLWPLPLADFHRGMLPSNFADLSNISSGDYSPGASTAAAFLSYFVEDYKKAGCTSTVLVLTVSLHQTSGRLALLVWVSALLLAFLMSKQKNNIYGGVS